MANLIGNYKLKARPSLPQTEVTQSLDFVISNAGHSISCTSVRVDSTGIAYFIQAIDGEDVEEPEYVLVYNAELRAWVDSIARTFLVEKEQTVTDEFDKWLTSNLFELPTGRQTIDFTVNGEKFTATKNTSWFVWFGSFLVNARFAYTPDDLVTYNNRIISYDDQDVNIYDFIVEGAEYSIKPQVNVYLDIPSNVEINPLFAKRNIDVFVLYPNRVYEVNLVCDHNYYAIPQSKTQLNDYVEYELLPDKLIISVGDISNDFINHDTLGIEISVARKIYDKLTETTTVLESEKGTIVELAPQYKVNIEGSYCVESNSVPVSKAPIAYDGRPVYGLVLPLSMLGQLVSTEEEISGIASSLLLFFAFSGIDPSRILIGKRTYAMDSWFVEYMNQELSTEDIIGEPIMILDYDLDKIMAYYIEQWAEKANLTVAEYIARIEQESGTQAGSDEYKAVVISQIEKEAGDIELIRYITNTTVTEEIANAISFGLSAYKTNLYDSYMSYNGNAMSLLVWYAVSSNGQVVKNAFSYKTGREVMYSLYNGETLIKEDFAVSDTNDFNLTSDGNKLNGRYLQVEKYVPPVDRYTPGTLIVSEQTCLSGDTLITMGDGSQKRIDQIEVGDIVKTVSGTERVIFSDARAQKKGRAYTDYYFNDGYSLKVIKDHRVYSPTHKRYVHISSLKIGDVVENETGTCVMLVNKDTVKQPICHYTLFTENCNGYYANGILCGNSFANVKVSWLRKALLKLYHNFILCKELYKYAKH